MMIHILVAPYTKVEESFNLQATHDILFHGLDLDHYDHHEFPGVVPRTFLGPIVLSAISAPFSFLSVLAGFDKIVSLYIVRTTLAMISLFALYRLRKSVEKVFGADAGAALMLVTCCQFHLPFYMSRTLPNTLALAVVNIGYSYWIMDRWKPTLFCFSFATVAFRCDLAVLVAPMILMGLLTGRLNFFNGLKWGLLSTMFAIVLSVGVDSLFWRRWLWPEGEVFWFNTVLNRSSEWGTFPFHWYVTSALPRALLATAVLIPFGIFLPPRDLFAMMDRRVMLRVLPVLLFVCLYSFLPHKELRFIFPAISFFNVIAAVGLAKIVRQTLKSSLLNTVFMTVAALSLLVSIFFSFFSLYVSHHNYPGALALQRLHFVETYPNGQPVEESPIVHMSPAACMTGISRFLERSSQWHYSKAENITDFSGFTYLITDKPKMDGFAHFDSIKGLKGVRYSRLKIDMEEQLFILKRRVKKVSRPTCQWKSDTKKNPF
eukprot:GILJ01014236.1.p1 GENE.GILJ01014236.1~~GILJ01014236.1.p1  ORF type:complete len:488 (-),score=59.12 GILJ01014236.1:135-1598(-)